MSREKRRSRKKKDRQRKVAVKKQHRHYISFYLSKFPPAELYPDIGTTKDFLRGLHLSLGSFRLPYHPSFTEFDLHYLKAFARSSDAYQALEREKFGEEGAFAYRMLLYNKIGQVVWDHYPSRVLDRNIPLQHYLVCPGRGNIHFRFHCLTSVQGWKDKIYCSPFDLKIDLGGVSYKVGYSAHAVRRICDRVSPNWHSYAGLHDVIFLIRSACIFELTRLTDGTLAFELYDCCRPTHFSRNYLKLLDSPALPDHCYYKVGYCPAVIDNGYLVAKTLILPGYAATPELELLRSYPMSFPKRRDLLHRINTLTAASLQVTRDFSLLQWFQDHGLPQVKVSPTPLFSTQDGVFHINVPGTDKKIPRLDLLSFKG